MVYKYKSLHPSVSNACLCTLILALAQFASVSRANFEHTCDYNSIPHSQGICGSRLSNLVALMCQTLSGGFFAKRMIKRDAEQDFNENLKGVMLNKREAFSYLAKRTSGSSIICECCYNQCSQRELMQYCALPPSFFSSMRQ